MTKIFYTRTEAERHRRARRRGIVDLLALIAAETAGGIAIGLLVVCALRLGGVI